MPAHAPLRVCFVTAEFASLAKSGGLADVAAALSRELHGAGHDVRVFLPGYAHLARTALERTPLEGLQNLVLDLGPHRYSYSISTVHDPGSTMSVYLVECPVLYHRDELYTSAADEHRRFLLLTRAAIEACQRLAFAPHILHCNDWHTAFGPLFLKSLYAWDGLFAATRTVLTIHNLGYQGVFAASEVADLGLGSRPRVLHQEDLSAGRVNSLRHGILYADLITTVSPTYAREICTREHGMGLDGDLRAKRDRLVGILNGVDYAEWTPSADPYGTYPFSADDLSGKRKTKAELLQRLKLDGPAVAPLIGVISRLVWQKGVDLLQEALPAILERHDCRFVALGTGDAAYEASFATLQGRYPSRVHFHRGYSDELAHWIEAASDVFVMPSRYEPCGLNQMYSLRYGSVPVVRRTGGLADSVQDYSPQTGEGTGIVFEHENSDAVGWALARALQLFADAPAWTRIMRHGMAQDFSWQRQSRLYFAEYDRLLDR
jgi:starch synthase